MRRAREGGFYHLQEGGAGASARGCSTVAIAPLWWSRDITSQPLVGGGGVRRGWMPLAQQRQWVSQQASCPRAAATPAAPTPPFPSKERARDEALVCLFSQSRNLLS